MLPWVVFFVFCAWEHILSHLFISSFLFFVWKFLNQSLSSPINLWYYRYFGDCHTKTRSWFQRFLFSLLLGEMIQFDEHFLGRWVETEGAGWRFLTLTAIKGRMQLTRLELDAKRFSQLVEQPFCRGLLLYKKLGKPSCPTIRGMETLGNFCSNDYNVGVVFFFWESVLVIFWLVPTLGETNPIWLICFCLRLDLANLQSIHDFVAKCEKLMAGTEDLVVVDACDWKTKHIPIVVWVE